MTEPAHRDLFTRKWRKEKAPSPSEYQIQIALIQRLKLLARKDCIYFHIPNGELRDKRAAAKLKAMGVMSGVPDLCFMWPEKNILFMELKREGGPLLSVAQQHFRDRCKQMGFDWIACIGLDGAIQCLEYYGIMGRGPARIGRLSEG